MRKAKLVAIIILTLALIILVVQNRIPVQAKFLWITVEMPVFLLLFLTAAAGFALGIFLALFIGKEKRKEPDIRKP